MPEQRVSVISDTHGLLRPEVAEALRGSSLIIHAGDVGKPQVREALKNIAPVVAVRRNVDAGAWSQSLPLAETVEIGWKRLYVPHQLPDLRLDPGSVGLAAVIFGHSHKPLLEMRNGVIFLNPGSAGPRRFKLPVSMAIIHVQASELQPQLIELARRP